MEKGIIGNLSIKVTSEMLASRIGSGAIDVFATPMMIAYMEKVAFESIQANLAEGESTVGVEVNASHMAATPEGMEVTFKSELTEVDGRILTFKVEAFDEKDKIGECTHKRAIIKTEKFLAKVNAKKDN